MGIANLTVSFPVPFPSRVVGTGLIGITKAAGVFTITQDYTKVSQIVPPGSQYAYTLIAIYNANTKVYQTLSLADLVAIAKNLAPATPVSAAQSPYQVLSTDVIILVDTAAPVNILLQPGSSRTGDLIVKDVTGHGAANNVTITPFGAEKVDNLTPLLIESNYGGIRILPYSNGYTILP